MHSVLPHCTSSALVLQATPGLISKTQTSAAGGAVPSRVKLVSCLVTACRWQSICQQTAAFSTAAHICPQDERLAS